MSPPGGVDLLIAARSALLDALDALAEHLDALVLIGAQAIYLHTGDAPVALAESTKDSDVALDPRALGDDPLLEEAMARAGFYRDLVSGQPGAWRSPSGIPVDLMVTETLAGSRARRSVDIPPHGRQSARRAAGLEAALVDNRPMTIAALDPSDARTRVLAVAGPAALLVAKLHKLGERQATPGRLVDKDAHDVYRLLVAVDTESIGGTLLLLLGDEVSGAATDVALGYLDEMFAAGPQATGSAMAGRAEELVGVPDVVSASVAALAADILEFVRGAAPYPSRAASR